MLFLFRFTSFPRAAEPDKSIKTIEFKYTGIIYYLNYESCAFYGKKKQYTSTKFQINSKFQ